MKTHATSRAESGEERQGAGALHNAAQLKQGEAATRVDARAASSALLRHQDMANHSVQAMQLKQRAEMMAGGGAVAQSQAAQLRGQEPVQGKFDITQRVEDEEMLQGKFETVQRMEEEELLQGKFDAAQRVEDEEPVQAKLSEISPSTSMAQLEAKPNNTGLPNQLKAGIESLSGMSMDHVKVHYNSDKPAQLNAHAYAQGSEIHVAPGQEQHLPHEAWHVVQQAHGRVKPTMQMKMGVPVNDDVGLETEANVMGARALATRLTTKQKNADMRNRTVATNSSGGIDYGMVQRSHVDNANAEFDRHTADYTYAKGQFSVEQAAIKPFASGDSVAANGLLHWAKETRRAAVQHYNELNSVKKLGGIKKDVYLGASNTNDPDVYVKDGNGLLEVKTNDTAESSPVDTLVYKAFNQLDGRSSGTTTSYSMHLYLENEDNLWPYNTSDSNKTFSSSAIKNRMGSRTIHISGNNKPVTIEIYYKQHGWITVPYKFDGS